MSKFARNCFASSLRYYSVTAVEALPESRKPPRPELFRTQENNPVNHTTEHFGRFYTVPEAVIKQIFSHEELPKSFQEQTKTFNEMSLMVRNPALEIMHYLRSADYSRPAIRYALFGRPGAGKSLTLLHLLHYAFVSEFILVHIHYVGEWTRKPKEVANSQTREGCFDLPLDAAEWLIHFKAQNVALLNKLQLRLTQDYVWSQREVSRQDAPLIELVEHGISRVKYASECVIALLKELKAHSTAGRCKTFVAINGFNAFFYPVTRIKNDETKKLIHPSKISLTAGFLDITKYDWCNGAVVVTLDELAAGHLNRVESEYPYYQLYKEGFEHLDPFIPVHVTNYTEAEAENCLLYYEDRKWLQNPAALTEEGHKELIFLSNKNPYTLMKLCAPL